MRESQKHLFFMAIKFNFMETIFVFIAHVFRRNLCHDKKLLNHHATHKINFPFRRDRNFKLWNWFWFPSSIKVLLLLSRNKPKARLWNSLSVSFDHKSKLRQHPSFAFWWRLWMEFIVFHLTFISFFFLLLYLLHFHPITSSSSPSLEEIFLYNLTLK